MERMIADGDVLKVIFSLSDQVRKTGKPAEMDFSGKESLFLRVAEELLKIRYDEFGRLGSSDNFKIIRQNGKMIIRAEIGF